MRISHVFPSNAYNLPTHPQTTVVARRSFDNSVANGSKFGRGAANFIGSYLEFGAKCLVGQRDPAESRAVTQHTKISFNEGAVGATLVGVQKVLAELAAIVGAVAGVLVAGAQTAVGASSTGTVGANALRAKNVGALAATLVTAPVSIVLDWARLAVEASLQVLPPIGTVLGGGVGSVVGILTSVLAGLGHLLNVSPSEASPNPPGRVPSPLEPTQPSTQTA